ncbi:hypothetical protein SO802_022006 [Lithocarpus litseifolius]|uniref:Reverse transcriptase zinc-binding domain-containing protein n=1 Tax=Lithocarpus litseifolius TaxID=425828 RepID=A0AAW2CLC6_9ROSI
MQTTFLPSRILDNLDRLNRNFLWGSSELKRRKHWVGWEKITQPLDKGVLGLQTAKGRNLAYLSKLNWRLQLEKDSLWARVLRKKYMTQRRMSSSNENSLPSSRIWKAMKKGMDVFKRGTRWSLGRDSNLRFWYDSWTSNGPLRSIIHDPLTREEEEIKVKDLASIDGWNWGKLSLILPPKICLEIQVMPRSHFANEEDRIIWNATANGNFNLSSAYILANGEAPQFFDGKWIWKLKVLPRIQSFIWMCFHNSIAT